MTTNNFELYLIDGQYITSGNAVDFCSGNSSIELIRNGTYNNGLSLVSSVWDQVASISFTSTRTVSSNIGYYDENNNWASLSSTVTVNQSGNNVTITGINMPTGTLRLFIGLSTNAYCTFGNLEILDSNGNSLLIQQDPPTDPPTEPPTSDYTLLIGSVDISSIYLGEDEVMSIYLGENLIYSKS